MENKNLISHSKNMDMLNVFFTVSPITSLVIKMIIKEYSLSKRNVLIVSFRKTNTSILDYNCLSISPKFIYRLSQKLLFYSLTSKKILKKINKRKFVLYSSWAFAEVNNLISKKNCEGHIYIEEGQGSYSPIHIPYDYNNLKIHEKFLINFRNRVNSENGKSYAFRHDASLYVGISNEVFPSANKSKLILDRNSIDTNDYNPKLKGITYIGLTCAARRLQNNGWDEMIEKLVKALPKGSYINLHPSFKVLGIEDQISKKINQFSRGSIKLCSNDTIIELEMIFEPKILVGPNSSLSIYAKLFNSKFINVSLY